MSGSSARKNEEDKLLSEHSCSPTISAHSVPAVKKSKGSRRAASVSQSNRAGTWNQPRMPSSSVASRTSSSSGAHTAPVPKGQGSGEQPSPVVISPIAKAQGGDDPAPVPKGQGRGRMHIDDNKPSKRPTSRVSSSSQTSRKSSTSGTPRSVIKRPSKGNTGPRDRATYWLARSGSTGSQ